LPSTLIFTTAALFCLIKPTKSGKPPIVGTATGAATGASGVVTTAAGAGVAGTAGVVGGNTSAIVGNTATLNAAPNKPVANANLLRLNMDNRSSINFIHGGQFALNNITTGLRIH
jgi:hypothetical protein